MACARVGVFPGHAHLGEEFALQNTDRRTAIPFGTGILAEHSNVSMGYSVRLHSLCRREGSGVCLEPDTRSGRSLLKPAGNRVLRQKFGTRSQVREPIDRPGHFSSAVVRGISKKWVFVRAPK